MNRILLKVENLDPDTHGVMAHKHEGREQGDVFTRQGTRKIASTSPEARERHATASSSQASEGSNTAYALIRDYEPSETGETEFLLFEPPGLQSLVTAAQADSPASGPRPWRDHTE